MASRPPDSAQRGNMAPVSDVLDAVYGYWSPATSMPSPLANSNMDSASAARPHIRSPMHLTCEICTRTPVRRPTSIASLMATNSPTVPAPSSRMCVE